MSDQEGLEVLSRRLDMATRAARIAVWEWDVESDSLYWSPVFMQIIGIRPEDFGGHLSDFVDRLVPEDRERVVNALETHLREGTPYDIEYEMLHQSGKRVAVAAQGQAWRDRAEKPMLMTGTVRDISDRRTLETRLLQAEHIAHIGHWVVDVAKNRLTWSPETFRIHGLDANDVQPDVEAAFGFYHPEDRARVTEAFAKVMQDGRFRQLDVRLQLGNGETRFVHIDGVAEFSPTGAPEKLFGIIHDRTELVKKERELERAHRLQAVGQLAGGVAHDFNNLMSVMLGNLELLRENVHGSLADDDVELINDAVRAITHGRALTQGLLNLARSAPLRPQQIAPNELLSDVKNVLRRTLPASLTLTVHDDGTRRCVFADRGNLEACLINLAINARDAIDGHGQITLSTRDVDVGEDAAFPPHLRLPAGPYVAFTVSDDGHGIAPDDLHRVFEPFFSSKSAGQGSGLGLSRVKGFAEQSGGMVWLSSELGKGTSAAIYLPACPKKTEAVGNSEPAGHEALGPLKILLVEDIEQVRRVIAAQLERRGHAVVAAPDSRSALDAFAVQSDIDLLLSDVVMPGEMQGPGLLRELRKLKPSLRAIFVSGYTTENLQREHGVVAGTDECLAKPVQLSELDRAIKRAMESPDRIESTESS